MFQFFKQRKINVDNTPSSSAEPPTTAYINLSFWRPKFVWFMVCLGLFILLAKITYIQLFNKDFLIKKSEDRTYREVSYPAIRGNIYDYNGELLALDHVGYSVIFNPTRYFNQTKYDILKATSFEQLPKDHKKFIELLAQALELNPKVLLNKILYFTNKTKKIVKRKSSHFIKLHDNIQSYQVQKLTDIKLISKKVINTVTKNKTKTVYPYRKHYLSLNIKKEIKRYYPQRELFSHIVGFFGFQGSKIKSPLDGVERWLNTILTGVPGKRFAVQQVNKNIVEIKEGSIQPQKGDDVYLTIDTRMQYFLYKALYKQIQSHHASSAFGLLVEVPSGAIRAMISLPSFNPNVSKERTNYRIKFRALTDRFESGSTQKPLLVAAGLESGNLSVNTTVNITNQLKVGNFELVETHKLGIRNVEEIIKYSINSGIVQLALKTDRKHLWNLYKKLGYTGTYNLLSGNVGVDGLPHYTSWSNSDYFVRSYGYGQNISLRELISFYVATANDGILPSIHLSAEHNVNEKTRVISEQTSKQINQMLFQVLKNNGTGHFAQVKNFNVAGKTGTVRLTKNKKELEQLEKTIIKKDNSQKNKNQYRASFVGFAPYENPKYVLAIVINNPRANQDYYSGGTVAAPVFSEVMTNILNLNTE